MNKSLCERAIVVVKLVILIIHVFRSLQAHELVRKEGLHSATSDRPLSSHAA